MAKREPKSLSRKKASTLKGLELAQDPTVRLVRRKAEEQGLLAVMFPAPRAAPPELRKAIDKLFAQGLGVREVTRRMDGKVSRSSVSKYLGQWKARPRADDASGSESRQHELPVVASARAELEPAPSEERDDAGGSRPELPPIRAPRDEANYSVFAEDSLGAAEGETAQDERAGAKRAIEPRSPQSRRAVQHAGTILLLAGVGIVGLHEEAERILALKSKRPVRIALDATIAALGIGESVRRLARRHLHERWRPKTRAAIPSGAIAWTRWKAGWRLGKSHLLGLRRKRGSGGMSLSALGMKSRRWPWRNWAVAAPPSLGCR